MVHVTGQMIRRGAIWTYLGQLYTTLGGFVSGIVLARLLGPGEFGVFIAVTAVTSLMMLVSQLGMPQAMLQAKTLTDEQTSSVFWAIVLASVVFFIVVLLVAEPLSAYFDSEQFTLVMWCMGALLLLSPHTSVRLALLRRAMRFDRAVTVEATAFSVGAAVSIVCALGGAGVFSLVAGAVTSMATSAVMLSRSVSWQPMGPGLSAAQPLVRYSAFTSGNILLSAATNRIDNILVGSMLGTTDLGLYNRAYSLSRLPVDQLVQSLTPLLLGSMARIQEDVQWSRERYFKALSSISVMTLPFLLVLLVAGPAAIDFFYGQEWSGAGPALQVMIVGTVLLVLSIPAKSLINAQGLVKELLLINSVVFIATIVAVLALAPFGLVAVAVGIAVREALLFWLVVRLLRTSRLAVRLGELGWVVAPVVVSGLCAVAMGFAAVYWVRQSLGGGSGVVLLSGAASVFLVYAVVLGLMMLLWRSHSQLQHTRGLMVGVVLGSLQRLRGSAGTGDKGNGA